MQSVGSWLLFSAKNNQIHLCSLPTTENDDHESRKSLSPCLAESVCTATCGSASNFLSLSDSASSDDLLSVYKPSGSDIQKWEPDSQNSAWEECLSSNPRVSWENLLGSAPDFGLDLPL